MTTARKVMIGILAFELLVVLVTGTINDVATKGGRTCETAVSDCGTSSFVNGAWDILWIAAALFVLTAILALILYLLSKREKRTT